jgi:hypothetical protein
MRKTLLLAGVSALALVSFTGRASAQEPAFGDVGHVAISAERLFGFVHSKQTISYGGVDQNQSNDTFTLLANPLGGLSTGYAWPRLALDAFVAKSVTIGGSLGVFYLSPDGGGSATGIVLAPRIGYAAMVGPGVAIWPRGGITYWYISSDPAGGGTSTTSTAFALTIEVPLTFLLAPRVAFLVGPTLDLGLGGSQSAGGASIDQKYTDYGAQAGILVFL